MNDISVDTFGNLPDVYTSSNLDVSSRELTVKRGIYDIEVEIYISGNWELSFMSNVKPGDFWQILKNKEADSDHCYLCVTKPIVSSKQRNIWNSAPSDPSIIMGVNKVVQAPLIVDNVPLLATPVVPEVILIENPDYTEFKDL